MKLLLYCTKGKPYLLQGLAKPMHTKDTTNPFNYKWTLIEKQTSNTLNGKIVGECDFEVEKMGLDTGEGLVFDNGFNKESQLDLFEIAKYVGNNYYYAIHIKNLHIYDSPRDLFHYTCVKGPRNMQYVYSAYDKNENILISINPEWLCKILNGEKAIEVRKKVLKRMVKND